MTPLPIADEVRAEADQGAWCPKLCTYACPVETATGHQDAVPWSFHRVVSDLAAGRLAPADAAPRLHRCSGCLACRDACTFEQDVPSQVRAGRAVSGVHTSAARERLATLRAGAQQPTSTVGTDVDVVVLPGHGTGSTASADRDALGRLLDAAGVRHHLLEAAGCCGDEALDLGDPALAATLAERIAAAVPDDATIVAIDPHCVLPDREVIAATVFLQDHASRLRFREDPATMTVHDPCLTARRTGAVTPPRDLLRAAGVDVREPEGTGVATVCSGAGLSLPLLDADTADATARRRAAMLGDGPAVTWCDRAADHLGAAGAQMHTLWQVLADRLETS